MTTLIEIESTTNPERWDVTRRAVRRVPPVARRTVIAVGAGVLTAAVLAVASGIAGHWG